MRRPADCDYTVDDLPLDDAGYDNAPPTPDCGMDDEEVESTSFAYSTRHPDDWVISGPLGPHGSGPGRRFMTWRHAERWAHGFYGERLRGRVAEAAAEGGNRWAFVIRGPRGSNG